MQQTGEILIINLPSRTVNAIPYLDISGKIVYGGEQGLLGMTTLSLASRKGLRRLVEAGPG